MTNITFTRLERRRCVLAKYMTWYLSLLSSCQLKKDLVPLRYQMVNKQVHLHCIRGRSPGGSPSRIQFSGRLLAAIPAIDLLSTPSLYPAGDHRDPRDSDFLFTRLSPPLFISNFHFPVLSFIIFFFFFLNSSKTLYI